MATKQKLAFSPEQINSAASAIATLSKYVKADSNAMKIAQAKKIIQKVLENFQSGGIQNAKADENLKSYLYLEGLSVLKSAYHKTLMKQAAGSYPDNSYTQTDANPDAKNVTIPEDSHYQTKLECTTRLVNEEGLTADTADRACSAYFDQNNNLVGGMSKKAALQRLVNANFGVAQATTIVKKISGISSGSRVERSTSTHGFGGGKSVSATAIPQGGVELSNDWTAKTIGEYIAKASPIRQGSISPPAWSILHGGINPAETIAPERKIKSANVYSTEQLQNLQESGSSYAMHRIQDQRIARQEASNLRSASLDKQKPHWLELYESRYS